jgi:hypothetical protein
MASRSLSLPLVTPALRRPALTNMWYVKDRSTDRVFAVCAAHSLVTGGTTFRWRIPNVVTSLEHDGLAFRIPAAHVTDPRPETDFALALVTDLPDGAVALELAQECLQIGTRLTFVFSHRFDYDGARIAADAIELGTHETTAFPERPGLLRVHDTGFPGFSGAAGLLQTPAAFDTPKFAALFVGIADPALPKSMTAPTAVLAGNVVSQAARARVRLAPMSTTALSRAAAEGLLPPPASPRQHGPVGRYLRGLLGLDTMQQQLNVLTGEQQRMQQQLNVLTGEQQRMQQQLNVLTDGQDDIRRRMLAKDDIKPLIRGMHRRWSVSVDAGTIHRTCREFDTMSEVSQLIRTKAELNWEAFEAWLAEE